MQDLAEIIPGRASNDVKVMVAMSGGVDSSTVAAYLHRAGYKVIGVTLQLHSNFTSTQTNKKTCCAGSDIFDAKRVAAQFGFLHYVVNMEETFRKEVIEDFAYSYLRGETPIPCIKCNQTVKFRDLMKIAKNLSVDALVTGHYVRRVSTENGLELHRGADPIKDQSYFLFNTTREQLEFLRFPLGNLKKSETRDLARKLSVDISEKPESQDICFVNGKSYADVIKKFRPDAQKPGKILSTNGEVLGTHNGTIHYTIGQRHGLQLSSPTPLYVVKIDARNNIIIVGTRDKLQQRSLYVKEVNWLDAKELTTGLECEVKLRSGTDTVKGCLYPSGDLVKVALAEEPQCAIAPGQACVMYHGSKVLGGGWIV
ncbi:tRNA 2-thiouridine(34) synthase MnmA [Neorickettsia findlayensis]|uniref:tRNA-specific 2-thiouridylase MnmA n=1 Tax=Neorickettsia findlayensis TaxID=2686014 RepID=A0A6P1GA62_9RICK|nr:tRNA 2-thiouridine(34) synthase MnmA [Neorickettsia findlayensis]QHD65198.1 tRNA 2-thiouridine(34) synthase MnmA [Neorickettsia findlayensis]